MSLKPEPLRFADDVCKGDDSFVVEKWDLGAKGGGAKGVVCGVWCVVCVCVSHFLCV